MSGPAIIGDRRVAAGSLDDLTDQLGPEGWEWFKQNFSPAAVPDNFDPGDEFKKNLAATYETEWGHELINWLLDLTCRAPYPRTHENPELLALTAAKHQARAAVGEVLVKAISDGRALLGKGATR